MMIDIVTVSFNVIRAIINHGRVTIKVITDYYNNTV